MSRSEKVEVADKPSKKWRDKLAALKDEHRQERAAAGVHGETFKPRVVVHMGRASPTKPKRVSKPRRWSRSRR